jgi:hypothetical protein
VVADYPMIEEDEAVGGVATVYGAALERAPFVPSLLKSLAVCPQYLLLAWDQASAVLDGAELGRSASRLSALVTEAAAPPADAHDRELVGAFIGPLGRMLLLSCGLLSSLEGHLAGRPPATVPRLASPRAPLQAAVPSVGELAAQAPVLGRIRLALDTPIVNSVWRKAAAEGRLEPVWDQFEPQAARTRGDADALEHAATSAATELPWKRVADRRALGATGVEDAGPGIRAILRAYVATLPRVLTLVASSGAADGNPG